METRSFDGRRIDLDSRHDRPAWRRSSSPLVELARRPPLTAEQECALGWRIRGLEVPVPPPGDARPSARVARNRLVEQNVRLVIAISRQYQRRGVETEDLIQEGLLSLHRAAERFDPARGLRFSTYATWWIRHAMSRACQESGSMVRIPEWLASRRPDADEAGADETPDDQRRPAWGSMRPLASLDAPFDSSGQTLGETLPDPGPTPEQEVLDRTERDELRDLIEALPRREREIVRLRLGLDEERPRLGLTGQRLPSGRGASRKRVYELAIRALRRLHWSQPGRAVGAASGRSAPTARATSA